MHHLFLRDGFAFAGNPERRRRVLVPGYAMDLSPGGDGRLLISLAVLALLAVLAWSTMDAGRYRALTLVLIGFFAFRVVLGRLRSR